MFTEHIPTNLILFFMLYGMTGVVPFMAAVYLLLSRGNAFAPEVTPPVRLRRWAASFFALSALGHVWWMLFYFHSPHFHSMDDLIHSAAYVALVVFDCVTMLTTLAGTLLSMLQDRRRRIWPVFVAMIPFVALGVVLMVYPSQQIMLIAFVYILLLYVLFTVYMVFAARRYGRWLNDNYADLENKKVWLSQVVTLTCLLLFILYTLVDPDSLLFMYLMHFGEIILFGLLLWRVETLPQLDSILVEQENCPPALEGKKDDTTAGMAVQESTVNAQLFNHLPASINLAKIEQLLAEHCVSTQLYLKHDLSLQQLAQAIGTNRSYLSQYFSHQGITYNTYINNLRINHFISRCQDAVAAGQPIVAQQLASESGYHSYSTFSLAFKQRMGQSVTAWMRETTV
ncbi:MAG: helix-turn-helix transcriptional regulator [Bacteroidaceae bacterium]|nr:helix-turn-helix transcriptional regulator [Bacteroidaceae bacterium]